MISGLGEAVIVLVAGVAAGTVNAIVGSGTLLTFPTLLACGLPPITANVSNTVGLAPGSVSGAVGYRAELAGQRGRLVRLGAASLLGGVVGAGLLFVLPAEAFGVVVPVLIGVGCLLVLVGPALSRRVTARAAARGGLPSYGAGWVWPAVLLTGVYGGYFGAAQGVLLMAVLGIGVDDTLQRHNATKNVLAALVNGVAAVVFVLVADVDWRAVGLLAAGSVVGGQIGATVGRRIPSWLLRALVVVVGVVALVSLLR